MKKFDWFAILGMLAIVENTIFMIAQGGWWIAVGLMFGGFWAWIAYWDWKHKRIAKAMDLASRSQTTDLASRSQTTDIQAMAEVFRRLGRTGISTSEFSDALNNACREPQFIGDVSCKWNARSPFLRCAVNPGGECQGCKDFEQL